MSDPNPTAENETTATENAAPKSAFAEVFKQHTADVSPEEEAMFDEGVAAMRVATNHTIGAEALAGAAIKEAVVEAEANGGDAKDVISSLWAALKECAEGIQTIEADCPDGERRAFELVTVETLTGARRRRATEIVSSSLSIGAAVANGGGYGALMEIAAYFTANARWCELLGVLYRADGYEFTPDAGASREQAETARREWYTAIGECVDEKLTVPMVVGVLYRFFFSSGSGLLGGIQTSLTKYLRQPAPQG